MLMLWITDGWCGGYVCWLFLLVLLGFHGMQKLLFGGQALGNGKAQLMKVAYADGPVAQRSEAIGCLGYAACFIGRQLCIDLVAPVETAYGLKG